MVERKCKSENSSKDDFQRTPKSVFCKAILYIDIDKTHLTTKLTHFFYFF